jgi:hypothetical protein
VRQPRASIQKAFLGWLKIFEREGEKIIDRYFGIIDPATLLDVILWVSRPIKTANAPAKETMTPDIANAGQIRLERHSPSYWRVTFDLPPLNIFGPKNIPQLNEVENRLRYYVGQVGATLI